MPHKTIKKTECPHTGEIKITTSDAKKCERCTFTWCWVCNAYLE